LRHDSYFYKIPGMTNILDKLNVLVRASLNNFLGEVSGQAGRRRVPAERLGKDIDQEVNALRKQIDDAISQEDGMQKRLDQLQQQIDSLDRQADEALTRGDEAMARYHVQQMQRQQQLAAMVRAELEQHRQATSDFIQRVNMLDAMISEARQESVQSEQPAQPEPLPPLEEQGRAPGSVLSDLLRSAREHVQSMQSSPPASEISPAPSKAEDTQAEQPGAPGIRIPIRTENSPAQEPKSQEPTPEAKPDVDEDLAKRRSRLSKPDTDNKPGNKPDQP
jgi:hypothetical protein